MKKILRIGTRILLAISGLLLLGFIIFYLLTNGDYEVARTVEQDPSIPHIKIGSRVFHAETFGQNSNEAVIALHGVREMTIGKFLGWHAGLRSVCHVPYLP